MQIHVYLHVCLLFDYIYFLGRALRRCMCVQGPLAPSASPGAPQLPAPLHTEPAGGRGRGAHVPTHVTTRTRGGAEAAQTARGLPDVHPPGQPPVSFQDLICIFSYTREGEMGSQSQRISPHICLGLACPRSRIPSGLSELWVNVVSWVVQVEWQLQRDMEWVSSRIRSKHQRAKLLAIR